MRKITLFFIIILSCTHLFSQQSNLIPELRLQSANAKPINLKELSISVFVTENIATTTISVNFYNPNNRVMEGELVFPLPDGATVSRFALDVAGHMREAVVVDKDKATKVFETLTRKTIDPGIVEMTQGNNYKARVYPIPANGYKKAEITFVNTLPLKNSSYIYNLPLNYSKKIPYFHVKAETVINKPKVPVGRNNIVNLRFNSVRNSYISEFSQENAFLNKNLIFEIPKLNTLKSVVSYKGKLTSNNFFYIPININYSNKSKRKINNLSIIWDISSSAENSNINRKLEILKKYIKWVYNGNIQLITFANKVYSNKNFKINGGKCNDLFKYLSNQKYDGATNIYSIDFDKIIADEIILFSDGLNNFGDKRNFDFKTPVIAINSSNKSNSYLLKNIANKSNGIYINATDKTINEIENLLTHVPKRFVKAKYNKENIESLLPVIGSTINDNFSVSGIAESDKVPITLYFGYDKNNITDEINVTIDNTGRIDNEIGEKIWAQKKLEQLLIEGKDWAAKKIGKDFSIVTPGTSLIVLDNVADYVRYEIRPPKYLLKQYNNMIAIRDKGKKENHDTHMKMLCKEFEHDYEWWLNSDKIKKKILYKEKNNINAIERLAVNDNIELEDREEAEEEEDYLPSSTKTVSININQWDSNEKYMNELKSTNKTFLYYKYLSLKNNNKNNPSFYFNIATYLYRKGLKEEALRVISNLAEIKIDNTEYLRVLGRKLSQMKFYDKALMVFNHIKKLRGFEPQSYLDLGRIYEAKGDYQKAIKALYSIINNNWDSDIIRRFPGIELITLHQINNIIYHHKNDVDYSFIKDCFIKNMPLDIRVVIDWDANDVDVDLHVTDPKQEECSYRNNETSIGGKISNDITMGYGPEEFRLKKAPKGKYIFKTNLYASHKQTATGKIFVRALVYTNYGKKNEKMSEMTLILDANKQGKYTIGDIIFE